MTADPILPPAQGHPSRGWGGTEPKGPLLFPRFIGLQFFFKTGTLACFALILAILRQQDKEEQTKVVTCPGSQQQPLVSEPEKKPKDSRV